jgi:hypothetical protein
MLIIANCLYTKTWELVNDELNAKLAQPVAVISNLRTSVNHYRVF